jgi:hypothetical protein
MEKYTTPELEVIAFENDDVITTSLLSGDDEMVILNA